jgi:hypothetical protein
MWWIVRLIDWLRWTKCAWAGMSCPRLIHYQSNKRMANGITLDDWYYAGAWAEISRSITDIASVLTIQTSVQQTNPNYKTTMKFTTKALNRFVVAAVASKIVVSSAMETMCDTPYTVVVNSGDRALSLCYAWWIYQLYGSFFRHQCNK